MRPGLGTKVAGIAFIVVAPWVTAAQPGGGGHSGMAGMHSSPIHDAMMKSMQDTQGMPTSGDTDRDFATMMRKHHEGGIAMAEAELRNGRDPKMKEMAQKIIDAQKREIRDFDEWLKGQRK